MQCPINFLKDFVEMVDINKDLWYKLFRRIFYGNDTANKGIF
jgi:hypothetical protein